MPSRSAMASGAWIRAASLACTSAPLPLEEAVFYLVTNVMAAQGFVMLTGYLRERSRK